jgi:hypothetical protein
MSPDSIFNIPFGLHMPVGHPNIHIYILVGFEVLPVVDMKISNNIKFELHILCRREHAVA